MEKKFKPFEKVLIRRSWRPEWMCDLYSHYNKNREKPYHTTLTLNEIKDENIIPYEGNEHLVGTTDEPDEEVRLEEGELIIAIDKGDYKCNFSDGMIGKVVKFKNKFIEINGKWGFSIPYGCCSLAIRFSNFNPNDMEGTRKHILCVKNGRIVKYREND